METAAWGTYNPSGDKRSLVGKIACVVLFSFGVVSKEGLAGLQAVCID